MYEAKLFTTEAYVLENSDPLGDPRLIEPRG